ncbi:MAG: hypothetical protein KDC24_14945, partial [Saprospiraceae bacterium]|nr:hypothetical protein [Saprospiraceae bacterium]
MHTFRPFLMLLSLVFLWSCGTMIEATYLKQGEVTIREKNDLEGNRKRACHDYLNYAPDTNHLDFTPIKYIRVNFHFMNSEDGSQNYDQEKGVAFAKKILEGANYMYNNNKKAYLPRNND